MQTDLFFIIFFFWRASVCLPLLRLCRPYMIFEGCLDSNPEYCRSKLARWEDGICVAVFGTGCGVDMGEGAREMCVCVLGQGVDMGEEGWEMFCCVRDDRVWIWGKEGWEMCFCVWDRVWIWEREG
jgi:hypothetical protein